MKHSFLLSVAVAVLGWSSLARASAPMSVFARVDTVTYEPDKANATRVQIHGVFALHTGAAVGFQYGDATPGYMYFA